MLLLQAGIFCRYLLVRFRGGPSPPADGGLPLVHMNGGDDGGPGGQGGGGAVLQGLPLPPGGDGDNVSEGHVGLDPAEPEVMFCFLRVLYCTVLFLSMYELECRLCSISKLNFLFPPP